MKLRTLASSVTLVTGAPPEDNTRFARRIIQQASDVGLNIVSHDDGPPAAGYLSLVNTIIHRLPTSPTRPVGVIVLPDLELANDDDDAATATRADLLAILSDAPARGYGVLLISDDPDLIPFADHVMVPAAAQAAA